MEFQTRYQQRKKQKMNHFLNLAIIVVILLIIYFTYKMFFGPPPNQPVAEEQTEEVTTETEVIEAEESEETEDAQTNHGEPEVPPLEEEQDNHAEQEEMEESFSDGEWKPVGTVQETENFQADFTRDSTNWNEMTKAILLATGLTEEDMIIWRLGNGGNLQSAVGTVSDGQNQNTPYQVRLEWTNQGWLPVEVIKLTENPYN
ncbi:YrrS family protein [Bacillus alkalicellulosilyticus]|uniref:YrrS family protein n=1 Tax=Alkalihalobacterium alkalicellulosilyticum TaxID=1912214 RepID=UPI000998BA4F|nr:YrrS family protein [Bacillus alkalicellulosilyticus]